MIHIAHRGNVDGPSPGRENSPSHIKEALELGFHVEVDLWGKDGGFWLGHDKPEYFVSHYYFLSHQDKFFIHCKNIEAIDILNKFVPDAHYFFHNTDDYTITSKGFIWVYPGKTPPKSNAIVVLPESFVDGICFYLSKHNPLGVCSDYVNDLIL